MQKVYLILRNNQQSGPFTLDEVIAAGVQPTDLIWVEGKSAAWRYPSEIKELQAFLPGVVADKGRAAQTEDPSAIKEIRTSFTPKANSKKDKKIFVSLPIGSQSPAPPVQAPSPEDLLEQKAEALRQRLQSYTPEMARHEEEPVATQYARTMHDVEEDYTKWKLKQQNRKKGLHKKHVMTMALLFVFIAATGAFLIFKKEDSAPAKTVVPVTTITNQETLQPDAPQKDELAMEVKEMEVPTTEATPVTAQTKKKPAAKQIQQPVTTAMDTPIGETTVVENTTPEETSVVAEPSAPETTEATPEKEKKTLGQAIDGFFGKFKSKKKEEEAATSGKASTGERRASKREEATPPPPDPQLLAQQVKVTANAGPENWMLGVKGLKLTLHNKSNYKLSQAVVEVAYYDEENTLLEMKKVVFQNIPANKNVTQPAPDHRLASYTKQQLVSVSGN